MDNLSWLLLLGGVTLLTVQWLMRWSLSPLNAQAIRYLFIQQLFALVTEARLLEESDNELTIRNGGVDCAIRLESLYRRCQMAPARAGRFIREAALAIQQALQEAQALPADWRERVMPLLFNNGNGEDTPALHAPIIGDLSSGYALPDEQAFRWITREDLAETGISEDDLHTLALRNLERSCNALVIEALPEVPDGNDRVIAFRTADGLDAARVLLPTFFQRFSPRFGDEDLLVAIPARDTLLMVAAGDRLQAGWLRWRAEAEFARATFPLLAPLLLISEGGLAIWQPEAETPA